MQITKSRDLWIVRYVDVIFIRTTTFVRKYKVAFNFVLTRLGEKSMQLSYRVLVFPVGALYSWQYNCHELQFKGGFFF